MVDLRNNLCFEFVCIAVLKCLTFSAASSKQKSTSSSLSGGSGKESTRKSSSLSATAAASKSSRKTSSDLKNSKDSDSEGNSFWSSFLGDSVSSNTSKAESKSSSRRTSGRKLGSRLSGGHDGGSEDRNDPDNGKTSKENASSARSLKQQKKRDINLTDSVTSEKDLESSSVLISQKENTTSGSKDLSYQDENATVSVNSQAVENASPEKAEYNTQELPVAAVNSENKAKSERLKLSSSGKSRSRKGKKDVTSPGNDVFKDQNDSLVQDVSAAGDSEVSKAKKAMVSHKEPESLLEEESQSLDTDTADSSQKQQFSETHYTAENILDTSHSHKLNSQDVEDGFSNVASKSMSSDIDGASVVDPTNNAVINEKAGQDIQQEPAEQNNFLDVEPLASSTPNHRVKEQSALLDKAATTELIPIQPADENEEGLNQIEDLLPDAVHNSESPATGIKENSSISENVTGMFVEAASVVEEEESPQSIPKQEMNQTASDVNNAVNRMPGEYGKRVPSEHI